jgi:GNAT superfamily N-acetyltransferase
MATKKINFDIESREGEEDRTTISINGIGEVVLVETFPEYEFLEDVGEDGLEELNVEEGDLIGKIEHLEIEDEYKGKGYAKLLMKKAIEVAKEKGLMPLYLNASPMGSKQYGLNIEDLTGFYESLGFEVFLRQGGNNLMILKDTYKIGGETKNKIMAKQIKIQFADNYANGGVTYSEWSKCNIWQGQFNDWMKDGNVSKNADGTYSTQDAQYTNSLKGISGLKKYFYNEFIKGQYDNYAGGGKAVKKYVVKGNVYDGGEILKETFDNIDEAYQLAREIERGWTDDGTYYLITIYNEKGKKVETISDDKYLHGLRESGLFEEATEIYGSGTDTKKVRQLVNENYKGYKINLQVRIASYPDNLTIFEKTFDSIFDVMDKIHTYYEEDYYAYINNKDLGYWEEKYSEIDENRKYIKGKYGWSFIKENGFWIAKDDYYDENHIVRIKNGKPVADSSVTKRALKQIIELENSNKYSDGGSTDDKHLIAKAIEYVTGYAVDTDTIQDEANNYSFKYKGRNVWSTLNSKLVNDTIRMHRKSLESRYAEGGSVGKGYNVFNYTDNIYATDEVFKTKKLANDFIREFRNRFSKQGYYRDNQMNKIAVEDIDLLAIPSDFNPFGKYEDGGRTMENRAKKQARKDIKTHLYRPQAPYQSVEKPSEEWERYELPYDTKMQYDFEPDSFSVENKRYSEYAKGGEAGFDNEGTSMVLYHEKNGNWLVPKGQVYLYLYDVENSGSKLGKEFDWVFYPLTAPIMAWQSGYIPPLKKIWTKKFQKDHKGSEHLLGVIKAYLIEEDGKKELFIDMMSVNPTKKKKGIMSYMIKELRESFNLSQDQVTFSDLTDEGKKFVEKKTYADGGVAETMNFFVVNNENDKYHNWVGYNIDETITDKQGNEFEKLYFENKKLPKKYNVNDLIYLQQRSHFTQKDKYSDGETSFVILVEYESSAKPYYYLYNVTKKFVATEGGLDWIKSSLPKGWKFNDSYSDGGSI